MNLHCFIENVNTAAIATTNTKKKNTNAINDITATPIPSSSREFALLKPQPHMFSAVPEEGVLLR